MRSWQNVKERIFIDDGTVEEQGQESKKFQQAGKC